MMKVLVTGGAGFIGSHVVDRFLTSGHTVTVWDNLSTGNYNNVDPRAGFEEVELLSGPVGWPRSLDHFDTVVHAAAIADISTNWTMMPGAREIMWKTNVDATRLLLEALPKEATFVFVSTAAAVSEYPSFYGASKQACESLLAAYHGAGKRGVSAGLRLASTVGKRYKHGHIADFVRMAHEGTIKTRSAIPQRGRPYMHVVDVAEAIFHAANGRDRMAHGCGEWRWSDTILLMRAMRPGKKFEVEYAHGNAQGWIGDPIDLKPTEGPSASVLRGVIEALEDLGW